MMTFSVFLCLLYATWRVKADIEVEGFVGGHVSFKCSHHYASGNRKYFCKNPCEDQKDIMLTVGAGGKEGSERITLEDFGQGAFTVTFRGLQLSDSGKYWCGVERKFADTYIKVHLTVKEAVTPKTTSGISSTVTYEHMSNATQMTITLTPGINTSWPKNISTESNSSDAGEQNITGAVVYVTVTAAVVLILIFLATWLRLRRKSSQPQPQDCSDAAGHDCALQRENHCELHEISKGIPSGEKISERFSSAQEPKHDALPAAPPAALHSQPIYENLDGNKHPAGLKGANFIDEHDTSIIYIHPIPCATAGRAGDGAQEEPLNKTRYETQKLTERCKSKTPPVWEPGETRAPSLWFGLDLSGAI